MKKKVKEGGVLGGSGQVVRTVIIEGLVHALQYS